MLPFRRRYIYDVDVGHRVNLFPGAYLQTVKWIGEISCVWCGSSSRVGIEGDGQGRCFRVICDNGCGAVTQAGRELVVGQKIQALLNGDSEAETWT